MARTFHPHASAVSSPTDCEKRLEQDAGCTQMALKAQKIALRSTEKQRSWFAQQCGYARVAFNYGLSDFKDGLSKDEFRSARDLRKRFMRTSTRSLTGAVSVTSVRQLTRLSISATLSSGGDQDKTTSRSIRNVHTVNLTRLKARR